MVSLVDINIQKEKAHHKFAVQKPWLASFRMHKQLPFSEYMRFQCASNIDAKA